MTQLDRLSLLIADHFAPAPVETLRITERVFPARVRADLQRALEELIADDLTVLRLTGVTKAMSFGGVSISGASPGSGKTKLDSQSTRSR